MHDIISRLIETSGTNDKVAILKENKEDAQLQRVLKMTYDKAAFTYGLTLKHWHENGFPDNTALKGEKSLDDVLDFIEGKLHKDGLTGNEAIDTMGNWFAQLEDGVFEIAKGILNRDLRINLGRTMINKVFKDLIIKPAYMRCGLYDPKSAKKINYPATIQLKADGTYREALVEDDKVTFHSRSGESYVYPVLEKELLMYPNGYYFGELTVRGITNRAEGNGLINSDNPPHKDIMYDMWDYVTVEEYQKAKAKVKGDLPTTPYSERFQVVQEAYFDCADDMLPENLRCIESHEVNSPQEAMLLCVGWMEAGLEGGVLKDNGGVFKDGTSAHQLKMKLDIDLEVRVTGFKEGKPGTKRESTFGALLFQTDDGQIQGACSGFKDKQLVEMNNDREAWIGRVITVRCNDITKGRSNDFHALSHPRFIEERQDKTTTDTLESAMAAKESAMAMEG